jgi:hypothetical protein
MYIVILMSLTCQQQRYLESVVMLFRQLHARRGRCAKPLATAEWFGGTAMRGGGGSNRGGAAWTLLARPMAASLVVTSWWVALVLFTAVLTVSRKKRTFKSLLMWFIFNLQRKKIHSVIFKA